MSRRFNRIPGLRFFKLAIICYFPWEVCTIFLISWIIRHFNSVKDSFFKFLWCPIMSRLNVCPPRTGPRTRSQTKKRVDFLLLWPADAENELLSFLDAKDLCRCCAVSKAWLTVCEHNELWRLLCTLRWRDKLHIDIAKLEALVGTADEEKNEEKIERCLINAAMIPAWHPKRWKILYREAERDAKRTSISKDEMHSMIWAFRMRFTPMAGNDAHDYVHFRRDLSYHSHMFGGPLPWRFVSAEQNRVQVAAYPPLSISRIASNWGWKMMNPFVDFHSIDVGMDAEQFDFSNFDDMDLMVDGPEEADGMQLEEDEDEEPDEPSEEESEEDASLEGEAISEHGADV